MLDTSGAGPSSGKSPPGDGGWLGAGRAGPVAGWAEGPAGAGGAGEMEAAGPAEAGGVPSSGFSAGVDPPEASTVPPKAPTRATRASAVEPTPTRIETVRRVRWRVIGFPRAPAPDGPTHFQGTTPPPPPPAPSGPKSRPAPPFPGAEHTPDQPV